MQNSLSSFPHPADFSLLFSFLPVILPPIISRIFCLFSKTVEMVAFEKLVSECLSGILTCNGDNVELQNPDFTIPLVQWLHTQHDFSRMGSDFWIDAAEGHNIMTALYLKNCGNKSVAVEHPWQDYLRTFGPFHMRNASRGLRILTIHVRKLDETANIRGNLPRQLGYVAGLQEIYARRVGLTGWVPAELGTLVDLRVLSMGNNKLCGLLPPALGSLRNLQRIVLHQNCLEGPVPQVIGELGCIVNVAGNPLLHHGPEVPRTERMALCALFNATRGSHWHTKTHWHSSHAVSTWYKVKTVPLCTSTSTSVSIHDVLYHSCN